MARINYYRFPEGVDAITRAENGAPVTLRICQWQPEHYEALDCPSDNCPSFKGERGCIDCGGLIPAESKDVVSGLSVSTAKSLLKKFGGAAWTHHIERGGGVFETTPIEIGKNNSRHKYNRHL